MITQSAQTAQSATTGRHLIQHGKSGALGCFAADGCIDLSRGAMVIVETPRGVEVGTVLCPAEGRSAELLGPQPAGRVLRCFTDDDIRQTQLAGQLAQEIFGEARSLAESLGLGIEILDVEVLFAADRAVLQFLGSGAEFLDALADSLQQRFALAVFFENLAMPRQEDDHHGACDKPDCGRSAGDSCTSCGTGGGCSSCGHSSRVDMRAYFAHLRGKMDERRTSLL